MKIIVTAGPSYEPVDTVRRLTNFSTGRLGTELAAFLADKGHEVILLRGELATFAPEFENIEVVPFHTAEDLLAQFARRAGGAEVIFHAAAVGDWRVEVIRDGAGQMLTAGKIPTSHDKLFLELIPTVKVLGKLRGLYPAARIVGWKYETDGGRAELLQKGVEQMAHAGTDGCVLNGPAWGEGFGFVNPAGVLTSANDSKGLFQLLDGLVCLPPVH